MAAREVARPTSRDDFEIAIVCTKDLEYNAVCLVLDGFWDDDGDPFGRAIGDLNTYTTGKATAAGTAASLRSSYPCVKLLLLTGTCDGVPNALGKELLLGDVVISDTVIQYDLGRRYTDGFREKDTLEDRLSRPDKNVRNLVTVLKTDIGLQRLEDKFSTYLRKIQDRASEERQQKRYKATNQYPGSTNDMLFESTYCHKHYNSPQCICDDYTEPGDRHKKKLQDDGDVESAQQPTILIGRFGSGDTSFGAGIDRDRIAQKHNIIAFETEGAGAWDELSCIIVKGVSTYGDGHRMGDAEAWENFAAATAACAARGLISRYPQTDKSLFVETKNQREIVFRNQADIACLRDLYITSPPNDKIRIEQTKGDSRLNNASSVLLFEDLNSWIVLSQIFFSTIENSSIQDLTFVIDALDDRNEANIQDVLLYADNQSIVSLELNAESVSTAIKTYIDYKVEILSGEKRYQQGMRDSIQEYLINNADGTFLWVALVCEMLERAPSFGPNLKSARYPPGLDNLYERMVEKVCQGELDWGRRILSINTVARRPLSIQELETLTFYPENVNITIESLEKRWEEALGYCGNFLTQRKGVVYFIHQSAKDFIINKASHRLFCNGMEYINKLIFKISISEMINILKRDIYGLSKPGYLMSDLDDQNIPSPDPLAPVSYCCVYWIEHLEKSISHLLSNIYQGQRKMHKLESLLADTKKPGLKEQLWDARRFIQMFGKAIGDAPLQVYISALLFSPVESITRKQFNVEMPNWVQIWPNDVTNWTSCIEKLDGRPKAKYRSLSISSCGTWLASSYYSSQEIMIWDVETGRTLRSIKKESRELFGGLEWFQFSPQNNNEMAVLNSWKTVIFWDILTTEIVRQIELPVAKIRDLSFLPSAPGIIGIHTCAYETNTYVVFFNIQKEEEIHTKPLRLKGKIRGRKITIEEIAFSPIDIDILAICTSTPSGSKIIIYNIDTDDVIHAMDFGWVKAIALSPDGKYLIASTKPPNSGGKTMPSCTLLDSMTGEIIFEISLAAYNRVSAFSADGQLLAVGTLGMVEIWDISSRQCIQKTEVTADCPMFSHTEKRKLFCGSDGCIDVIETGQHEITTPTNTQMRSQNVLISPNDTTLHSPRIQKIKDSTNDILELQGSWVTLNGERLIWLPPEYRPTSHWYESKWDTKNSCIAISNPSKSLFILNFDCSVYSRLVAAQNGGKRKRASNTSERDRHSHASELDDDFFILRLDMDSIDFDTGDVQ
ncbi:hypothetical protein GGI43DRAFT_431045 [Trichoderma evansii]